MVYARRNVHAVSGTARALASTQDSSAKTRRLCRGASCQRWPGESRQAPRPRRRTRRRRRWGSRRCSWCRGGRFRGRSSPCLGRAAARRVCAQDRRSRVRLSRVRRSRARSPIHRDQESLNPLATSLSSWGSQTSTYAVNAEPCSSIAWAMAATISKSGHSPSALPSEPKPS